MRDIKEAYYEYPAKVTKDRHGNYTVRLKDFPTVEASYRDEWTALHWVRSSLGRHLEKYILGKKALPMPSKINKSDARILPIFDDQMLLKLAEQLTAGEHYTARPFKITDIYLHHNSQYVEPDPWYLLSPPDSITGGVKPKPPSELPELITITEALTLIATGVALDSSTIEFGILLAIYNGKNKASKLKVGDLPIAAHWLDHFYPENGPSEAHDEKSNSYVVLMDDARISFIDRARTGDIYVSGFVSDTLKWEVIPSDYFYNPLRVNLVKRELYISFPPDDSQIEVNDDTVLNEIWDGLKSKKIQASWKEVRVRKNDVLKYWPKPLANREWGGEENSQKSRSRPRFDSSCRALKRLFPDQDYPASVDVHLMQRLLRECSLQASDDVVRDALKHLKSTPAA